MSDRAFYDKFHVNASAKSVHALEQNYIPEVPEALEQLTIPLEPSGGLNLLLTTPECSGGTLASPEPSGAGLEGGFTIT